MKHDTDMTLLLRYLRRLYSRAVKKLSWNVNPSLRADDRNDLVKTGDPGSVGLIFIPKVDSPFVAPLLAAASDVRGSVALYTVSR